MGDKIPEDLAMAAFNVGIQQCKTTEEASKYCQMLSTLSIKTMHGIEGQDFKAAFLGEAIKDQEMITPQLIN